MLSALPLLPPAETGDGSHLTARPQRLQHSWSVLPVRLTKTRRTARNQDVLLFDNVTCHS